MKLKLNKLYSQRDNKWSGTYLGFNTSQPYTIGNFGCKLTCLAMYASAIGKDENPLTMNEKLKQANQFSNGGELNNDNCFGALFGEVGIKYQSQKYADLLPDSILAKMKSLLDAGYLLFAEVDFYPATVNEDMHFVLINGYDGDTWHIVDPWTGTQTTLAVYGEIKRVLYRVWTYDKTLSQELAQICMPIDVNENNVKKATQWDSTVKYLEINKDPKDALFDDAKSVIAGYKARETDSQNKTNEALEKLALCEKEVKNRVDQLANERLECQKSYQLLQTSYDALKNTSPTIENVRKQYEATILELQATVRGLQKDGGQKDLEITALKTKVDNLTKNQAKQYKIGELLTLIWNKVKILDIKL